MKKSYNPADIHQKEGQEQSKKLYRYIRDHVKSLDDARACARTISELFKPSVQVQRSKFKEYCERLIFTNPQLNGRKFEELLWRKGFYEVVATAKQLKTNEYTSEDKSNLESHINAGIGHYHHYIAKIQEEFDLDLNGIVDFIYNCNTEKQTHDIESLEWAELSVHRSLIYLGDLCRYKLDLYPNWDNNLVIRYYSQALCFKPEYGMPHNQMGTLANNNNNSLDATYHYVRSLCCPHIFEGTENNLHRLFEKNATIVAKIPIDNPDADCIIQPDPSEHIKRFIARFLSLVNIWWFNEKIPRIYDLCHQTNVDLQECMTYLKPLTTESVDTNDVDTTDSDSTNSPAFLSHEVIFKIVIVCLLCINKLQSSNSQHISSVIAFTLAVYSQLVQTIVNHVQEGILNFPLPPAETNLKKWLTKSEKLKTKKKRRRRKLALDSEEESSDTDASNHTDSEEEPASDAEVEASSSEEDEDVKDQTKLNGNTDDKSDKSSTDGAKTNEEILKKAKLLDVIDLLAIIGDETVLQCVKILNDWLMTDVEILKYCGKLTRSLLHQIVNLVNLLNLDFGNERFKEFKIEYLKSNEKTVALPEDVVLKGVDILTDNQKGLDWLGRVGLSVKEQTILRMMKIVSFGRFLTTIHEIGVVYDKENNLFIAKADEQYLNGVDEIVPRETDTDDFDIIKKSEETKALDTKGQLMKMKHMGQLWLTAEVKDLESRVRGKASLSPYLVLDADSLILHTSMVKQLVFSRKFIVLVPSAVVSALDDLKRMKLEARDAIRWLESQFHQGNRFFRAQRPQERLPIPYIKYPKKKEKDSQIYIQIIECCHYLAQQQKGASNLVTLLLGNTNFTNSENKDISYMGLAQSAGVNLESISDFYMRWKRSIKGKR